MIDIVAADEVYHRRFILPALVYWQPTRFYWFDIPVQVKAAIVAATGRTVPLTDRYSEAVDAAAMAPG